MVVKLRELADRMGAGWLGDPDREITGVAGLRDAGPGMVSFLANPRYRDDLARTRASAVVLHRDTPRETLDGLLARGVSIMLSDDPYHLFARIVGFFHQPADRPLGISPHAVLGEGVEIGRDVSIHPFVRIEDGVRIGDRVRIYPGCFIGAGSEVGEDSLLYPNVTVRERVRIGKRVVLHSGVVVGSDGFGFATREGKHQKFPQIGTVWIQDDVELGANVTVDRAALGTTIIGRGTKVDNLVQIAHNVVVGEDCLIVAQAGISGSTEIGSRVVLAGQVGVVGHLKIGDGARIGAQSGVAKDVEPGAVVSGSPAIPHGKWLRAQAVFAQLPDLKRRIGELERRIGELEAFLRESEKDR